MTPKQISVGLIYASNGSAAGQLGVQGVTIGDLKADQQIIVDDLNRHGGIAGRTVVPVYFGVDSASTETAAQIFQRMCTYFTEDHPVFAIIASGFSDLLLKCALSRGVVVLQSGVSFAAAETFRTYPFYIEPFGFNLDRAAAIEVDSLARQKYFAPWNSQLGQPGTGRAKVGIVTYDEPAFAHATDKVMTPALNALGYPPEVVRIQFPQANSEVANMNTQIQSAILKFRNDNVEHVILLDGGGLMSLFFIRNASSQQYFPRYGINSQNGVQALLGGGTIEASAVQGAVGAGWSPISDLSGSDNPDNGPYSNASRRYCVGIMKAGGQSFPDPNAQGSALALCDGLFSLRDAFKSLPPRINQATFLTGVNGLGASFSAASTIKSVLSRDRHDAASAYLDYAFVNDCGCMRYTGNPHHT